MTILFAFCFLSFGLACYFLGVSKIQRELIKYFEAGEDTYFEYLQKSYDEINAERKLWTNKALVRGGTERIFADNIIFKEEALLPPNQSDTGETKIVVEPPFSSRRKQWKKEHDAEQAIEKGQTVAEIPKFQQEKILEELEEIKEKVTA